jgi:hypothetical protein
MITLAWKAITSLVVSFGLSAWFDVKKGRPNLPSGERRLQASRPGSDRRIAQHRDGGAAGRAVCGRASFDNLSGSAQGSLGEGAHGFKSAAASAIL